MLEARPLPPYLFPVEQNGVISIRTFDPQVEIPWPRLIETLRERTIRLPFMFSAPELQLEPLFYLAARACRLPVCIGTVYNMPVTREIIDRCKPDMLVAPWNLAEVLLHNLELNAAPVPFGTLFLFGERIENTESPGLFHGRHIVHDVQPFGA